MQGWSLLIATLVGAALGGVGYRIGEEFVPGVKSSLLRRVNGERKLEELFDTPRAPRADICLFTATARDFLPLTDILYFEFLRLLLRSEATQEVLLGRWYPVRGISEANSTNDWSEYDAYVDALFTEFKDRVRVVRARGSISSNQLTESRLFWTSLRYVGAEKHLDWAPTIGLSERRYRRLARTKAGDRLAGTVAHAVNNAELSPYLVSALTRITERDGRKPIVGVLFWELELDRLVVFQSLHLEAQEAGADCPDFDLMPMAGRTVRGRFGTVSNNHSATKAIGLVADVGELMSTLREHDWKEVRQYRTFVAAVLRQNYGFETPRAEWQAEGSGIAQRWQVTRGLRQAPNLSKSRLQLLFLLTQLRDEHQVLLRSSADNSADSPMSSD